MSLRIRYEITDLTGDDHRAGTLDCWQNDGVFSADAFTPPLLEAHDYTLRAAIELYGGGLSPWSEAERISRIEQAVIEAWLQGGATTAIGWRLADPSIEPPIDLQLRVNDSDWIDLPNPGGSYYLLDPRRFHALTDNAWLGQTVTLTARARLNENVEWIETQAITSQGVTGITRPVFGWSLTGAGVALQYTLPPNTTARVWLSIDGGPAFEFDPSYPANKTLGKRSPPPPDDG